MSYLAILPEIILTVMLLLVLVWKIAFGDRETVLYLGILGTLGATAATVGLLFLPPDSYPPGLHVDGLSRLILLLILLTLLGTLLYSGPFLDRFDLQYTEWTFLLLTSAVGLSLLVSTDHLVVMFVGLELFSICFYILCGYRREARTSIESSLKYFILGSVGSAIFLLGIGLVFASSGSIHYLAPDFWAEPDLAFWGSLLLVLFGLAFKLALVPFHVWVPDVYQGAPTPVTTYMSIVVKLAVFGVLIRLFVTMPVEPAIRLDAFLWWLALLTMLGGNLLALVQEDIKRMLAYSSIAHAGYALVGLAAGVLSGYASILFYLTVYLLMTLTAFGIVSTLTDETDRCRYNDLHGLSQRQPVLAFCLAISMISLAGLPITAGFMGKLILFYAAVEAGLILLVVVAVLMSLVSVAYYFRVIVHSYMKQPDDERSGSPETNLLGRATAVGCTILILIVGVYPAVLIEPLTRLITVLAGGGS